MPLSFHRPSALRRSSSTRLLELRIPRHSNRVRAPGVLRVVEERGLGEVAVGSDRDRALRETGLEPPHRRPKQSEELADTANVSRAKPRSQQHSGPTLEDEQRVIHPRVVVPVEEGELLLSVRRIPARVDVEDELVGRITMPSIDGAADAAKPLEPFALQQPDRIPVGGVFQPRDRRLRPERSIDPVNHGSHRRVVPQEGRIVRVLVAGRDLVDPLSHEIDDRVADVTRIAPVRDELSDPAGEVELLIELAQQHQPRVTGDLSTLEINDDLPLESEPRSTMTPCSHRHPSAPAADVALASASVADSKSAGGFLIDWFVNYPG